jgi:glutathione S-transferase
MNPTITAFKRSPDAGRGLARDTRVRWALEEVQQPYDVRYLTFTELKEPSHRALNPFGQIPTFEVGELIMFETGAIILYIGSHHAGLLPGETNARARAISWMFAALNSVEPAIIDLANARIEEREQPWFAQRMPLIEKRVRARLDVLANHLGSAMWLDGEFSAGDLLMVSVIQRLKVTNLLDNYPTLLAYIARAEARPAFQRAFAAQLAAFNASANA